jgi:hypothetical protein
MTFNTDAKFDIADPEVMEFARFVARQFLAGLIPDYDRNTLISLAGATGHVVDCGLLGFYAYVDDDGYYNNLVDVVENFVRLEQED